MDKSELSAPQAQQLLQRISVLESELKRHLSAEEISLLDNLEKCYQQLCSVVAMENRIQGFQSGLTSNTSI